MPSAAAAAPLTPAANTTTTTSPDKLHAGAAGGLRGKTSAQARVEPPPLSVPGAGNMKKDLSSDGAVRPPPDLSKKVSKQETAPEEGSVEMLTPKGNDQDKSKNEDLDNKPTEQKRESDSVQAGAVRPPPSFSKSSSSKS